jgi:phage baseplate assembly protein V
MFDAAAITTLVKRLIDPVRRALVMSVSRGVVNLVNESYKMQNVQVALVDGETQDDVEHFQEYGFTSRAKAGAEALALAVGGNRGHVIIACVTDRSVRPIGLAEGDVCLFGILSGPMLYLSDATGVLSLGGKPGNPGEDFAALATACGGELTKVSGELTKVQSALLTGTVMVQGAPVPIVWASPYSNGYTQPASVAATKVKAT